MGPSTDDSSNIPSEAAAAEPPKFDPISASTESETNEVTEKPKSNDQTGYVFGPQQVVTSEDAEAVESIRRNVESKNTNVELSDGHVESADQKPDVEHSGHPNEKIPLEASPHAESERHDESQPKAVELESNEADHPDQQKAIELARTGDVQPEQKILARLKSEYNGDQPETLEDQTRQDGFKEFSSEGEAPLPEVTQSITATNHPTKSHGESQSSDESDGNTEQRNNSPEALKDESDIAPETTTENVLASSDKEAKEENEFLEKSYEEKTSSAGLPEQTNEESLPVLSKTEETGTLTAGAPITTVDTQDSSEQSNSDGGYGEQSEGAPVAEPLVTAAAVLDHHEDFKENEIKNPHEDTEAMQQDDIPPADASGIGETDDTSKLDGLEPTPHLHGASQFSDFVELKKDETSNLEDSHFDPEPAVVDAHGTDGDDSNNKVGDRHEAQEVNLQENSSSPDSNEVGTTQQPPALSDIPSVSEPTVLVREAEHAAQDIAPPTNEIQAVELSTKQSESNIGDVRYESSADQSNMDANDIQHVSGETFAPNFDKNGTENVQVITDASLGSDIRHVNESGVQEHETIGEIGDRPQPEYETDRDRSGIEHEMAIDVNKDAQVHTGDVLTNEGEEVVHVNNNPELAPPSPVDQEPLSDEAHIEIPHAAELHEEAQEPGAGTIGGDSSLIAAQKDDLVTDSAPFPDGIQTREEGVDQLNANDATVHVSTNTQTEVEVGSEDKELTRTDQTQGSATTTEVSAAQHSGTHTKVPPAFMGEEAIQSQPDAIPHANVIDITEVQEVVRYKDTEASKEIAMAYSNEPAAEHLEGEAQKEPLSEPIARTNISPTSDENHTAIDEISKELDIGITDYALNDGTQYENDFAPADGHTPVDYHDESFEAHEIVEYTNALHPVEGEGFQNITNEESSEPSYEDDSFEPHRANELVDALNTYGDHFLEKEHETTDNYALGDVLPDNGGTYSDNEPERSAALEALRFAVADQVQSYDADEVAHDDDHGYENDFSEGHNDNSRTLALQTLISLAQSDGSFLASCLRKSSVLSDGTVLDKYMEAVADQFEEFSADLRGCADRGEGPHIALLECLAFMASGLYNAASELPGGAFDESGAYAADTTGEDFADFDQFMDEKPDQPAINQDQNVDHFETFWEHNPAEKELSRSSENHSQTSYGSHGKTYADDAAPVDHKPPLTTSIKTASKERILPELPKAKNLTGSRVQSPAQSVSHTSLPQVTNTGSRQSSVQNSERKYKEEPRPPAGERTSRQQCPRGRLSRVNSEHQGNAQPHMSGAKVEKKRLDSEYFSLVASLRREVAQLKCAGKNREAVLAVLKDKERQLKDALDAARDSVKDNLDKNTRILLDRQKTAYQILVAKLRREFRRLKFQRNSLADPLIEVD
ncbi:hypothetical protein BJ742DRAFT_392370 [Cladochytrium replicatum]|nr:hypothetical protein BJ742DRAFT_392370 [Cladochytrium replicatum]